jgi:kynurenine formamidase
MFVGMPMFHGMPSVTIGVYATHEDWEAVQGHTTKTPGALHLSFGDHTGTHVDAVSHMGWDHTPRA